MNNKKQNNSWINSLNQAKEILNLKGFHLVKKNTKLYSLAKKIQSGGAGDSINLVEPDKPVESVIPQKKYVIDEEFKKD